MAEAEKISVAEMLRATGNNTQKFLEQVAQHIEKLEYEVTRLQDRVNALEAQNEPK